ncbi:related to Central kinetochore subunit MCM22 [Zygosaccharomyces bailii ISA1307]|nr:related to Central kinetochore subunit MCM22 [Zygosaccharomyces bailii ISA1307]
MRRSDINDELFETYINSIEQQIEDKQFFLSQARNVVESLRSEGNRSRNITLEQWQDFLKKPMFFPERSDPIGLNMVSASLVSRQTSTEEWLHYMEEKLNHMQTMIGDQEGINRDMLVLIELLEQRPKIALVNIPTQESPSQRNQRLRLELEDFVKNYIALDLADAGDSTEEVQRDLFLLLSRLVHYDKYVKTTDFQKSTKGLFRLLLRSNLITIYKEGNARYVRLLDFAT